MKMKDIQLKSVRKSTPEETLEKGERIIQKRTGIIQRLYEHMIDPDDPCLFYYTAKMADISLYSNHKCSAYNGGASLIKERAKAAAIGESVERYCSAIYDEESFVFSSYNDIKADALDPRELALFSEKQYRSTKFKFSRTSPNSKMNWVWGYSLVKRHPILVPACCVYVSYLFKGMEEMILHPISTGLAAGNTMEEAILSGIYEVVERDSFMIMWHNRLSMPGVNLSTAKNNDIQKVMIRYAPSRLKFCVSNITMDTGIPTFASLIVLESGHGPAAAVGAAARLDPELAILKSLEEAAHTRFWVKSMMKEKPDYAPNEDFSDIKDLSHHPLLYGYRKMFPKIRFMTEHPYSTSIDELSNKSSGNIFADIQKSVEMITERGLDVIAVDITTSDIAHVGFSVVRIIIPGTQDLDVEFKYRYLGGKRLYEVPYLLGYPKKGEEDFNRYPHPFP